jgi:O-succinylbenzoate synthase
VQTESQVAPLRAPVDDAEVRYLLQYRRYRLPLRAPLRTAHGVEQQRDGLVLRLEDSAGRVGYGEVATLPWFGTETTEQAEAVMKEIGPEAGTDVLSRVPVAFGCLRHGLAAAQAALAGDEGGVTDDALPKSLPVAALLPAGREVLPRIGPLAEAGFRTFKWKVGVGDVADELALLDDVCARLPEGAKLRLDANGAWSRRAAERWLERAAERPVEFVEQPAFAKAADGTAQVRRTEDMLRGLAEDFPTPIALDESLVGDGDVARWLAQGWPGVFVLKPSLCGDVSAVLVQLAAAKAAVVFSSALETAVGAKSALSHAFRWQGPVRALGFGVWPLFADARFDGPFVGPFMRREDVARLNPEAVWNALS